MRTIGRELFKYQESTGQAVRFLRYLAGPLNWHRFCAGKIMGWMGVQGGEGSANENELRWRHLIYSAQFASYLSIVEAICRYKAKYLIRTGYCYRINDPFQSAKAKQQARKTSGLSIYRIATQLRKRHNSATMNEENQGPISLYKLTSTLPSAPGAFLLRVGRR
jgi:hypothetical protein